MDGMDPFNKHHGGEFIMTIADLIKKLQKYDQTTNVYVHAGSDWNDYYNDLNDEDQDNECVWSLDKDGNLVIDITYIGYGY